MPRYQFVAVVEIEADDKETAQKTAAALPHMVEWKSSWGPYRSEFGTAVRSRHLEVGHNPQEIKA